MQEYWPEAKVAVPEGSAVRVVEEEEEDKEDEQPAEHEVSTEEDEDEGSPENDDDMFGLASAERSQRPVPSGPAESPVSPLAFSGVRRERVSPASKSRVPKRSPGSELPVRRGAPAQPAELPAKRRVLGRQPGNYTAMSWPSSDDDAAQAKDG